MKFKRLIRGIPTFLAMIAPIFLAQPAMSQSVSVSRDGNLTVMWLQDPLQGCKNGRPVGSYAVNDGVTGLLYPTTEACQFYSTNWGRNYGGDVFHHTFADVSGSERCVGSMTAIYGGRDGTVYKWTINRAVPSFQCSTVGQRYDVLMK
jgi:hypothetical protein